MIEVKEYSECHFASNKFNICSNDSTIKKIASLSNVSIPSPYLSDITRKKIIDDIKTKTNCESESCIYESPMLKQVLGDTQFIIKQTFKPKGPYNSDDWLDNLNIDGVLKQNMEKYKDFYAIPFQMIDFVKQQAELATLNIPNLIKRYNTVGVVINTDTSTGKGKHWFALFMDFRKEPYTLEFFNSSGNLPVYQIQSWMNKTKRDFEKLGKQMDIIIVNSNELQKSSSECGVFSLWFILGRLEGKSVSEFKNVNMGPNDEKMIKFRKWLFKHS